MSYRKIEVNGKTYEYVIGQVNTKIKGIGVFNTLEIGGVLQCSCGPEYNCYYDNQHAVTPKDIKELILKHES